ncbi:hypothetical protein J7K93_05520 [bacterium]|nr:hypothetical protein [bacterium]
MKPLPYILSAVIIGFGGLAEKFDNTGHSVTIVVRHVDKFNIQTENADQIKTSALHWTSTRNGKKITVKRMISGEVTDHGYNVIRCNGGTVAENMISAELDMDFIVNLSRSGECILYMKKPKHGRNKRKEVIIYTITDTY